MTGLGAAVLHHVDGDDALPQLIERIEQIQSNGAQVLIIAVLHPVTSLLRTFRDHSRIDPTRLGVIDCTGEQQRDEPGDTILFVDSPSMVESILVRTDRLLRRMGDDVSVIVHTIDSFTLYSPPRLVGEFAHCLVHNMRARGVDVEFLSIHGEAGDAVTGHIGALIDPRPEPTA